MKHFIIFLVILLNSCMNDSKNSNAPMINQEGIIELFGDEDGDGIFNTEELNYSLDRKQFDVPQLSFEEIIISGNGDNMIEVKTEKSKNPKTILPLLLNQNIPIQYQMLTNLKTSERYAFERLLKASDGVELELAGKLSWSQRKMFKVNSVKAYLGIYQYHNSSVTPLSAPIVWRNSPEGHFYEVTRLKSDVVKNLNLFLLPWDFVLVIEDLEWEVQSKKFSWSDVSQGLYILQVNGESDFQQLYFNQMDVFSSYAKNIQKNLIEVMPSHSKTKLLSKQSLIDTWKIDQKINHSYKSLDSFQLVPISKNKMKWNRVDIKLLKHRVQKYVAVQDVLTSWTGQRPCRGPSERKSIRICEGQTINLTCRANYENYREQSENMNFKLSNLIVETAKGVFPINEWVKLSGAEYLERGELIRWEGLQMENDQLIPIYIQNQSQPELIEYGYLNSECSNVPEHAVRTNHFDMSRRQINERVTLEINVSEF